MIGPGSIVQLKSSSPKMTVDELFDDTREYLKGKCDCSYFSGDSRITERFHLTSLEEMERIVLNMEEV